MIEIYHPRRPAAAQNIKVTSGLFLRYVATANPIAEHVTIREDATNRLMVFELSSINTTLDGVPFKCDGAEPCAPFPAEFVPNHTHIAALYWATDPDRVGAAVQEVPGSGLYGSDALVIIPADR